MNICIFVEDFSTISTFIKPRINKIIKVNRIVFSTNLYSFFLFTNIFLNNFKIEKGPVLGPIKIVVSRKF